MDKIFIKANQQILRTFTLLYSGTVLVRTGQEVRAGEPIAEIEMPERYQVFDVVNNFKINPKYLDNYVERLVGELVKAGDVIAQKPGLFSRIFRASQDGMIVSIRDSKITVALGKRKEQVQATFPGMVVELIPERGAVIAAQGSLLQGAWGNGLNAAGVLLRLSDGQEGSDHKDVSSLPEGCIIVLDSCSRSGSLRQLLAKNPIGLVFGSISPELLSEMEHLPIPVMSLTGFGDYQVDSYSRAMLDQMAGETVYLNANIPDPLTGAKPELILPGGEGLSPGLFAEKDQLEIGDKVRLLGKPYTGGVGIVIELPEEVEMFASGLLMQTAVVRRQDEQIIRVPRENLEVILD